jgi:hypothetical protein
MQQEFARRKEEDLLIWHDIKFLQEVLGIPEDESENVEVADVDWGECPECKAPGGKYLQISNSIYLKCCIDFL